MKWFWVVTIAAFVAAAAIGIARVTHYKPVTVEAVVAASLLVIIIALFGFLAKSKD